MYVVWTSVVQNGFGAFPELRSFVEIFPESCFQSRLQVLFLWKTELRVLSDEHYHAILRGYHTLLTIGRSPIVVLSIEIDHSLVDVSVNLSLVYCDINT